MLRLQIAFGSVIIKGIKEPNAISNPNIIGLTDELQ